MCQAAAVRVAYVNTKGGVGKTTAAVYTAAGLALDGRTVLVDADPDASAQSWAAAAADAGEKLAFTVVGLTRGLLAGIQRIQLEGRYDHVVIDTPPGYGDRELSRTALLCADAGVIPLSPRMLDADRLKATVTMLAEIAEANPELRPYVLLNQVRPRTTMSRLVREFLQAREFPLLGQVGLREEYAVAFGHALAAGELGEWDPVVSALLDGHRGGA
jgi:chromosome partitioning protein